jgi:hypothetical protein
MNDCTRFSHSFCLPDIVKSIGRSSLNVSKWLPHCPPAAASPQDYKFLRKAAAPAAGADRSAARIDMATFKP